MQKATFIFLIITLAGTPLLAQATVQSETGQGRNSGVLVEQKMVTRAVVQDRAIIRIILQENLLTGIEPRDVEYMEIFDATGNGFGDEDVLIVYPEQRAFTFIANKTLKQLMQEWEVSSENQIVTINQEPEYFEQRETRTDAEKAKNWMLASLLRGVNNNYEEIPIKIYFERSADGGINFNMWGYSQKDSVISWSEPDYMPGRPVQNYDVFRVHRVDSVTKYISNTTIYDQIYIYHQTHDTVYALPDSTKVANDMTAASLDLLPGLIYPDATETTDSTENNSRSDSQIDSLLTSRKAIIDSLRQVIQEKPDSLAPKQTVDKEN